MSGQLAMADCHNDLLIPCLHRRERGQSDPFGDFWLPQLRDGGVVLQVLPVFVEEQYVGEGALRRTLLLLDEAWQIARQHPDDVAICLTGADIERAIDCGRIALVLALEGGESFGSNIALVRTMFQAGVRMVSLTWNRRTMLADGVGERDTGGRLTGLGIDAVQEMSRLGIILDVSHLSENGFWHVDSITTAPLIASHSSCRALQDHPRNLTDRQIRAIGEHGGFVAINAFAPFLADSATSADLIAHVQHAMRILGADRVGLGPDFMADLMPIVDPILGGALIDLTAIPMLDDVQRPGDLAGLGAMLVDALGEEDAAWVNSGTLRRRLAELLPAVTS